jgi:RNA polymerase-binding transcription factor DksA
MAIIRKKLLAKPAPGPKTMGMNPAGKGKPAPKKPAEKAAATKGSTKPAGKPAVNPATAKAANPATAKAANPAAAKAANPATAKAANPATAKAANPATAKAAKAAGAKLPKTPPILNKGALAAKEAAAKRLAEIARVAAEKAEAEAKRPRKLVPATANAIRPGAAKPTVTKGKSAQRPPAEVRPLGVLPPESMAKAKVATPGFRPSAPFARPLTPTRPSPGDARGTAHKESAGAHVRTAKGDERLSEADLKHFETRLLEERARIMREMGHLENTILKVNPRDSAGEVGGYSFHMADAGTDSMEREISFDIASKEGRLLREIDDALRRIYNGVYGICEASGKTIARARLEALPWARYTLEEQAHMEMKQRAGRLAKEEE